MADFEVREPISEAERAAAADLRIRTYRDEQQFQGYVDADGRDSWALHLLAVEDGVVLGTARVLFEQGVAKFGRLAVEHSRRGEGIGRAILRAAIVDSERRGLTRMLLKSQLHALELYRSEGFVESSGVYMEGGIEHVSMERNGRA